MAGLQNQISQYFRLFPFISELSNHKKPKKYYTKKEISQYLWPSLAISFV